MVRADVIVSLNASKPFEHPLDRQGWKWLVPKLFKNGKMWSISTSHMGEIFLLIAFVAHVGLFE